ncbi:hypothetical protein FQR65_LT04694 [Abscondita terminalis]|nr:hypothetical protein FQR65_LT04694 [Abscondita terminalis]
MTADEYLLGSKSIKAIPVALSVIASNISGITLLGVPPDVYLHGPNFFFTIISIPMSCMFIICLYLPVILKLEVPNGFEYLKLRFNPYIRMFASAIVVLQIMLLNPVMAYTPAIAFSYVTGLNVHLVSSIVCIVCIFYTTVGGFKAVIWTDVFQLGGMILATAAVLYLGVSSVGGFDTVWIKVREGERLNFDFSIDPTIKDGFWSIIIGSTILWINHSGIQPSSMQKYLSISNRKNAKWSCIAVGIGGSVFLNLSVVIGLVLYAKYRGCDPLSSRQIKHGDQLVPYFIVNIAENIPGIKGIFTVGLFSASLSSLSSAFNSLGATIYGDFVKPYVSTEISQKSENYILKFIVAVSGMLCIALTFVVEQIGSILTFANATQCCIAGLMVGLFSLGMLFPFSNSKGALWGTVVSFIVTFWIAGCHEWYKLKGAFNHFAKPLSVDNCTFQFNLTSPVFVEVMDQPFYLYRLSYWYNSFIGFFVLIVVGVIVSWCTKPDEKKVDMELISPIIRYLYQKRKTSKSNYKQCRVKDDLEMTTYNFESINTFWLKCF